MTSIRNGSGTQFNMNVNEVISNRCCQIAGTARVAQPPDMVAFIRQHVYKPAYREEAAASIAA